ncbi:uncharacterized protein LOC117804788 isoform X5 [Xyrichtys novacula]|uniref:Uncharacterized protein LOC117804788 isoform X5 n=1 Tax=Xyrichtys novacula TaxID=13765 RepID=A0AAV1F434_XYRNO|nr:uncharacterized protein LOC117804788 isoform X5 [Xyrichtys novacula]
MQNTTHFLSCTPVEDEVSPAEDTGAFAQNLLAFISEKIVQYQKARALKNTEETSSNIVADPPSLVTAPAVEEHNSKASKGAADPTSGDCATSAPEKYSTECPHIIREVAICREDEDESPGPVTTVPRLISGELTEKHHSSTSDCCPPQGESRLHLFDQLSGVSTTPKQIIEEDQLVRGTQSLKGVRLIHVHGDALQTDLLPEKTSEPLSHDALNLPIDKTQIHADLLVPSQNEWLGNKVHEQTGQRAHWEAFVKPTVNSSDHDGLLDDCQFEGVSKEASAVKPMYEDISDGDQSDGVGVESLNMKLVKNPEYEDISENEDTSEPATKLPNGHLGDLSLPPRVEDPQSESQKSDNMEVGRPYPLFRSQETQTNNEQMLFNNKGPAHLQSELQLKEENLQEKLIQNPASPKSVSSDIERHCSQLFCDESCDRNLSVLQSSARFENEESDDQTDDDWIVIPIILSDLRFESDSEDQKGSEKVLLKESNTYQTYWQGPTPLTTCASSEIEVFETLDSFVKATDVQIIDKFEVASSCSTPDHEVDYDGEPGVAQKCRRQYSESEDTEDSCDYPSESKLNHITASRQLLEQMPEPLTPATKVDVLETEGKHGKVRNVQRSQTSRRFNEMREKLRKIIQAKVDCGQLKVKRKITVNNSDQSSSDSEPDSEGVKRGVRCAKKKRRFPLNSETSEDSSNGQHGNDSSEKKRHKFQSNSLSSVTLQASQGQSNLCDGGAKCGQNNAEPESVQRQTEKHDTFNSGEIFLGSESEDKKFQKCKQKARRRCSKDRGDPMFIAKVAQQSQSELGDKKVKENDLCSDQQMESKSDPDSVRCVTDRDSGPIIIDSDLEDESSQNHNTKAERRRLSSPDVESSTHKAVLQKISTSRDVIVLSSASDSDDEQYQKRSSTLGLAGCLDNTQPMTQSPEPFDTEFETAQEKPCETRLPSAGPIQPETVPEEPSASPKSDQEVGKNQRSKKAANEREIISTSTEDSSDDTFSGTGDGPPAEPVDFVGATANRKPENDRLSSESPSKRQHRSMDRGADPVSVIPRLFVSNLNQQNCRLKLESQAQIQAHENPAASSKVDKSSTVQNTVAKPSRVSRQLSLPNHTGLSDNYSSLSSTNGPLTEVSQSSVPSKGLPLAGVSKEVSTAGNLPRSRHSSSPNRQYLACSKVQRSLSYNNPPTSNQLYSPSEGSSYSNPQLARTRLFDDWKNSFPNKGERRRRRSRMDDSLRTTHPYLSGQVRPGPSHSDSAREVRPEPSCRDHLGEARPGSSFCHSVKEVRPERIPRRSHKSFEVTAPLMKKTIGDYKQLPKATSRDPARKQRYPVGENYKWRKSKKGDNTLT